MSTLFLTVSDNVFALFSLFLQKATLIENFNVKINPHLQETHRKKQINLNFTDHTISHDVPFLSCWACLVQNMLCCVLGTFRGITPFGAVTPRDSLDGKMFIVMVERNNYSANADVFPVLLFGWREATTGNSSAFAG